MEFKEISLKSNGEITVKLKIAPQGSDSSKATSK